jgi:hypothetical protein
VVTVALVRGVCPSSAPAKALKVLHVEAAHGDGGRQWPRGWICRRRCPCRGVGDGKIKVGTASTLQPLSNTYAYACGGGREWMDGWMDGSRENRSSCTRAQRNGEKIKREKGKGRRGRRILSVLVPKQVCMVCRCEAVSCRLRAQVPSLDDANANRPVQARKHV